MKKIVSVVFLALVLGQLPAQREAGPDSVLRIMRKVADWQLASWEHDGMRWPKSDWTNAACYTGLMALNRVANDSKYLLCLRKIAESLNWNTGPRRQMADDYCIGQTYAQLYWLYQDPIMIARFRAQMDSLAAMPHDESLEWIQDIAGREWAWCDALYMGPPSLAALSLATGDKKYLDLAVKLWWKTTDYLYDTTEHLYFRDSRFFAQRESNGKKMFWARGNGWVLAGLARLLDFMPESYPRRDRLVSLFVSMATRIAGLQHADGSWHTALLDSVSYPAKETSGTGFYVYALAWGVNHGYLDYGRYYSAIQKGWLALTSAVQPDGKLGYVQQIGEKPGKVDKNSTEVYGPGAFLLAGSQVIEWMLRRAPGHRLFILQNPSGLDRPEEVAELPYGQAEEAIRALGSNSWSVLDTLRGQELAGQLEYEGGNKPVRLLLQVSLAPGAAIYACLRPKAAEPVTKKTYARYVPERADDFAWENDRIAFRLYGKALEGTPEDAYGLDVWVKRTNRLILDERYKRGEYHIDHGDGLDFYHVGYSLGDGNIAPYEQDSIWYSKNYHRWQVLDNGPLRSSFRLEYDAWDVNGLSVRVSKTISLDAGSQLSRVEAVFTYDSPRQLPVVVGIVKRPEAGVSLLNEQEGVMGYWEPTHGSDGTTGLGSVFPDSTKQMMLRHGHLLTELEARSGLPLIYYTGAVWDKAGLIRGSMAWFRYLQDFRTRLKRPLVITW